MLEINQIHHGDCLELMHEIPDGSIDMVLADLPYGTTACAWDSIIDLDLLWGHYKRIIKPRGAIVLTASQPFTTVLINSNLEWFKYELIWRKNRLTNFYNTPYQPGKSHENIVVFSNAAASYSPNGSMIFNPQIEKGDGWKKRDLSPGRHTYHVQKREMLRSSNGGRYPKSVLEFDCEFKYHQTQKPVALFAYLINTYTNPGDLVLDNAAGSGTTAIAAIQTGRNWLCIEKDADIYQTAASRIAKALGQPFTPAARAGQPNNGIKPTAQLGLFTQD